MTKNVKTDIISTWRFNMAAGIYNITIDQGGDSSHSFVVSGQTLDGYGARAHLRRSETSPTLLAEFTCTVSNASANGGVILMELSNKQTIDILGGNYKYDLEVFNDTTEKIVKLLRGNVEVLAGVTK